MLALVAFALTLIGVASVFALRDYLVNRIDGQLSVAVGFYTEPPATFRAPTRADYLPPSDFFIALQDSRATYVTYDARAYQPGQLPDLRATYGDASERAGEHFTVPAADGSRQWRVLAAQSHDGRVLTVGEDLSSVESAVDRLVLVNLFVGLAVLLALGLVGVWVVRRSLRPLVEIERTAGAIAAGDLTQRVPEQDPGTELGRLSGALNTMLAQIETAFHARASSEERAVRSEERMRQFVADASHELRTPLTTIRGFAELYRQGAAGDPGSVLRRIEDEAARMGLLVEDLLLLARLDRERPLRQAPVALAELVGDAAAAAHAVDPDRTIEAQLTPGLAVLGDEARLRQVVGNLVTNALTHTPPGTPVTLRLFAEDGQAVIEVSDTGPGLTAEQAERVFERFYRIDKARTRRAGTPGHSGVGLGLAIVAALVAAHDGTVQVDSVPGVGATFRVRLPLAGLIGPRPTSPDA
ncbi:MAG: sensor histidine kinase [Micromonosporaceae bacterium]